MAGVRLEFAQFGDFDSFDILRATNPMDIATLPTPLATGILTMYYVDAAIVDGATYYYRARVWRDGTAKVSDEVMIKAVANDEYWDNVVALMHFDNNMNDATGRTWTAVGSPSYDTSDTGFGKSLAIPDGTSYITSSSIDFGASDFTIEFKINIKTARGGDESYSWVLAQDNLRSRDWSFALDQTNTLYFSDLASTVIQLGVTLTAGWRSIALVRHGSQFKFFVDGLLVGTTAKSGSMKSSARISLGYDSSAQGAYSDVEKAFEVDELRITNGIARYTENYTPPDAPFVSS